MKLMDYDFRMEWIPGVENKIADALNRNPTNKIDNKILIKLMSKSLEMFHDKSRG